MVEIANITRSSIALMSKLVIVAWDNLKNIINSHNKNITNSYNKINGKTCNCRKKSNFPLDNKCLTDKIVYKAEAETIDGINELSPKNFIW